MSAQYYYNNEDNQPVQARASEFLFALLCSEDARLKRHADLLWAADANGLRQHLQFRTAFADSIDAQ